jgi:transcriptional regulator with XRE-family HTH domain
MSIHIGKEIERIYQQSGMKLSEFAKRINTSSRNVYSIFERAEIKTDQLLKIGEVLKYDFFSLYSVRSGNESSQVSEPPETYTKRMKKVVVTIELDGQQATLENHIQQLTAINQLI